MNIYELPVQLPITITVKMKNSNQLEWKTKVLKTSVAKKHILIPQLKHEGKVLSFNVPGIIIEVTAQIESELVIFKQCRIRAIVSNGAKYHEVISLLESTKENRRKAERAYINEIGSVLNNTLKQPVQACIKDLSATGFSYMIHEQDEPLPHLQTDIVEFTYQDSVIKEEIVIFGKIIRREKAVDGFITYGCGHVGPIQNVLKTLSKRGVN